MRKNYKYIDKNIFKVLTKYKYIGNIHLSKRADRLCFPFTRKEDLQMEDKEKLLEKMAARYHEGVPVDQILEEELGLALEEGCESYRKTVREFFQTAGELEERYRNMTAPMAVFAEIDRVCAQDLPKRFRMLSDLKYMTGMQNLELGRETLKAEGLDADFLKKALEKSHEEELAMAEEADLTEIEALQQELSAMLGNDQEKLQNILIEAAKQEGWETVLESFKEVKTAVTDQVREDLAVLAAALEKMENPEISMEELVINAAYQEALDIGMNLCILDLAILGVGAVSGAAGIVTGIGFLEELGILLMGGGTVLAGALILAASGIGAYHAAKELAPHAKELWKKIRASLKKAAEAAKRTVTSMIGTVSNKVFRPAIEWTRDTAVPVIREKAVYPLKRRLARMMEWIREKAEQIKEFLKKAAAWEEPRDGNPPEAGEAEAAEASPNAEMEETENIEKETAPQYCF